MNVSHLFITLLIAFFLGGCVAIPLPPEEHQYTEGMESQIKVGQTSRDEIIKLLGEPELPNNERFLIYRMLREPFKLLFIIGGAGGAGGGILPVQQKHFTIILEFDEKGILTNYTHDVITLGGKDTDLKLSMPEEIISKREMIFNPKAEGIFNTTVGVGINSIAFSPDGARLATGGYKLVGGHLSSKKIYIKTLDTASMEVINTVPYNALVFSPDFSKAALIDNTVTLVNLHTSLHSLTYTGHGDASFWTTEGAVSLAFDPNSSLIATGGYKGFIKIWNSKNMKEFHTIKAHKNAVVSLAYSKDGKWLVSSDHDSIKVWDTKRGVLHKNIPNISGTIEFASESNIFAINSGDYVQLWKIESDGLELKDVFLLPKFVSEQMTTRWGCNPSLDFSKDGRYLAASNCNLVIYELAKRSKVVQYLPSGDTSHSISENEAVRDVEFSPDSKHFATGTSKGVFLWELPSDIVDKPDNDTF